MEFLLDIPCHSIFTSPDIPSTQTRTPRRNQIQPSSQPIPRLRDLLLNNRDRLLIISTPKVHILSRCNALGKNVAAYKCIRVARPDHTACYGVGELHAGEPGAGGGGVGAGFDGAC